MKSDNTYLEFERHFVSVKSEVDGDILFQDTESTLRKWDGICLHHSLEPIKPVPGRDYARIFNEFHYVTQGYKNGLGYHFVISWNPDSIRVDNITASHRWKFQMDGSHAKNVKGIIDEIAHPNRQLVGVCIVGNFDKVYPGNNLLRDLNGFIEALCAKHDIPKSIYFHNEFDYKTCPGIMFQLENNRSTVTFRPMI